ncbi:MAG: peroxiredoxin [Candidatus Zixiibacteriota bacterium]
MRVLARLTTIFPFILIPEVLMSTAVSTASPINVGMNAPDFTLPYATRDSIAQTPLTLSAEVGKGPIVLAFYPADWSGGCTKEVCSFRDAIADLGKSGARIWAISGDYVYSHHEWAKHHNLPFELLSDHDHAVARLYDSFNPEKGLNNRTVYVVDSRGIVAYVNPQYNVADSHDFEALRAALAKIK